MRWNISFLCYFMGNGEKRTSTMLTAQRAALWASRAETDKQKVSVRVIEEVLVSLPALNDTKMRRMSLRTPGLSITELTRTQRLFKWNPGLFLCPSYGGKTNKHTWSRQGFTPGPKNARSLSIKSTTLYAYTVVPSWVHLQMQTEKFLEEAFYLPQRKVCPSQTDWLTQWKQVEKSRSPLLL